MESLSRSELIDLCREKNISCSGKKKQELIDLLTTTKTKPKTKHYIFHADWTNVLPYLEDDSVQLILADTTDCIEQGLRILDSKGLLVIRNPSMTSMTHIHTTEIRTGRGSVYVLCKSPFHLDIAIKTPTDLYEILLSYISPDSVVVLPSVGDGAIAKLVCRKRPMIAMDADESRIQYLYSIIS